MDLLLPHNGLIFWTIFAFLFFVISLIAIIQILSSKNTETSYKLMWVIIVMFMPLIGSLLYFIMGRKRNNIKIVE